jgi:hypothetical protein
MSSNFISNNNDNDNANHDNNENDELLLINKDGDKIEWTVEHEKILTEWGDKAMCYKWLHSKSNNMYSRLNAWYTIPVIVISTLTGTANFAQERVPVEYQNYFVMIVGAFNITAGIITTIQQFLKITQLNEAHRVSSISWDKFYRNIKIELAKHPSERMNVNHMIKICKEEYDRLMETSPTIPENIIKEFGKNFKGDLFKKINKPDVCDGLIPTDEFRNPWYSDENKLKNVNEHLTNLQMKETKIKKRGEHNFKTVQDFIILFKKFNNREPMETEIYDNLKDKMDIITIKNTLEQIQHINLSNNKLENV